MPIGILGTVWGYVALKEMSTRNKTERFDLGGRPCSAFGLIAFSSRSPSASRWGLDLAPYPFAVRRCSS